MKITLSCEPWQISNNRTLLKLKLEGFGEEKRYEKVIEDSWFKDSSIFLRIVEGMARDIQELHNKESKLA